MNIFSDFQITFLEDPERDRDDRDEKAEKATPKDRSR
jgi:hypothetical protein